MKGFPIVSVNQIAIFILVFARMSGVFLISPLLSNRSVPERIKVILIFFLSLLLIPAVTVARPITVSNHIELLVYVFEEVTIGLIIGFVASLLFSTVQAAGEIFGMQVGYSIATIFDPSNETDTGVLTTLYVVLGALFFLYLNGHHLILTSVTKSFEMLPLAGGFNLKVGYTLSVLVQKILVVSIQISAPVLVVVTILNLIFGLITKISPQMNIYFNVGFIIGPIIGIGVLILSLPLFRVIMNSMVGELGTELLRMVHELKGT